MSGKPLYRCVTWHISNKLFIIREVNSDMPIYILVVIKDYESAFDAV